MQLRAGGLGHISVRVGECKSIERSTFASQKKKKKGLFLNRGEPKKRVLFREKPVNLDGWQRTRCEKVGKLGAAGAAGALFREAFLTNAIIIRAKSCFL